MADNQQLKKSKQGIIYKEKPTLKLLTLGATKTKKNNQFNVHFPEKTVRCLTFSSLQFQKYHNNH